MAEPDLHDWLTVTGAAMAIGCSKRTIERLAAARKLEARLRRQEGTAPVAVYNPEDVARIAKERRPEPPAFVLPAGPALAGHSRSANGHGTVATTARSPFSNFEEARAAMVSVVTDLARALHAALPPPPPPKPDTVAEVAEKSAYVDRRAALRIAGVSYGALRQAVKAGEIKQRGRKYRRTDLEQL